MAPDDRSVRRRRILKALAASGTVALAGCGGGGDGGGGGGGGDGDGGGGDGGDGGGDGGDGGMTETPTEGMEGPSGTITFVHIGSFKPSANDFKSMFNGSDNPVTLKTQGTPAESTTTRSYYINQFTAQSSGFDVGMMDVIWPAEFASKNWSAPVEDPNNYTDKMLSTPVESATIDGTLYGMPMFTDANGFYYRKDLLQKYGYDSPPETYMEVVNMAQDIKKQSDKDLNGYIWQGGANEGLTIMWLNWLWGYGGSVRDGSGNLVVNTDKGIKALQHAVDLIHKYEVTPKSIPSSGTDGNRQTFQQGGTIFMRNWPYAYALFQDDTPVTDKFAVTTMPKAEGNPDANNSCLGGWSLFINNFSKNKAAAQKFANFIATEPAQQTLAAKHSRLPVRKALYQDDYWSGKDVDKPGFLDIFSEIAAQTSARPASPKYSQFSKIVYTNCNQALTQTKSPKKALDDAQATIDSEINNA